MKLFNILIWSCVFFPVISACSKNAELETSYMVFEVRFDSEVHYLNFKESSDNSLMINDILVKIPDSKRFKKAKVDIKYISESNPNAHGMLIIDENDFDVYRVKSKSVIFLLN
jgi:hypothetical protein